jgi:hypothetical protein
MHMDSTPDVRIVGHLACVVFDRRNGKIAHVHQSITFEGARTPSKENVASRAMSLSRELGAKLPGIKFDRLEVMHVDPAELIEGAALKVDLRKRRLIVAAADKPPSDRSETRRPRPRRSKAAARSRR